MNSNVSAQNMAGRVQPSPAGERRTAGNLPLAESPGKNVAGDGDCCAAAFQTGCYRLASVKHAQLSLVEDVAGSMISCLALAD